MASILSQNEIDDLLNAVGGSGNTKEKDSPPEPEPDKKAPPAWKNLTEFLEKSDLATQIRPSLKVRISRETMTIKELIQRGDEGSFDTPKRENLAAELLVEGRPVATGKIIKKEGRFSFKIEEVQL